MTYFCASIFPTLASDLVVKAGSFFFLYHFYDSSVINALFILIMDILICNVTADMKRGVYQLAVAKKKKKKKRNE